MNTTVLRLAGALLLPAFLCLSAGAAAAKGVEDSYHGQLGHGTGSGMLEKWCALSNFSFDQQGGVEGWSQECGGCHVGALWNPGKPDADCYLCHNDEGKFLEVRVAGCMNCHVRGTAKRGDLFTAAGDVHIAAGLLCHDCHAMAREQFGDHQFLKGTLSCTDLCHDPRPHAASRDGDRLNRHVDRIACETCHTGTRPAAALARRSWNLFEADGKPKTEWRDAGWLPEHKWYDNTGPGLAGDFLIPILGYTERRDAPGAKIHPFNAVTVTWFVKAPESALDDVIVVPEVQAADADNDGAVTLAEMRAVYPDATLRSEDMNFSISHSVLPKEAAFSCDDCHGHNGWVLDWAELGYDRDPFGHFQAKVKRKGQ
jgi:methanogenesis multiheme c-type cytochrome